jgi:formate dehydrogenase subunit gamma
MDSHFKIKVKNGKKYFFRFTVHQRIQHIILASMVIILALTGMPLKFHDTTWAPALYSFFGGINYAPVIHKSAGIILCLLFVYHVFYLAWNFYHNQMGPLIKTEGLSLVRLIKLLLSQPLMPNLKDLKDILSLIKYLLFLTDERPDGSEWTWKEKADYWAPFWGAPILGFTGLIMWQKELATRLLPGEIINFALIAHSDEALLAVLFLFIWHWYNVHFSTSVFPMGTVFITGYLSEDLMVEDHYEYYVKVMKEAGLESQILPPKHQRAPKAPVAEPLKVELHFEEAENFYSGYESIPLKSDFNEILNIGRPE